MNNAIRNEYDRLDAELVARMSPDDARAFLRMTQDMRAAQVAIDDAARVMCDAQRRLRHASTLRELLRHAYNAD